MSDLKPTAADESRSSRGYASVQEMLDATNAEWAAEFRESQLVRDLVDAAIDALSHVEELREAWRTGAISERDGLGGTRSNRNVEIECKLRDAIAALGMDRRERLP